MYAAQTRGVCVRVCTLLCMRERAGVLLHTWGHTVTYCVNGLHNLPAFRVFKAFPFFNVPGPIKLDTKGAALWSNNEQ